MYCPLTNGSPDLDKEYSPSWNTKRFQNHPKPNEKVVENFVRVLTDETKRVQNKYNVIENVQYGKNKTSNVDNNQLDIYYKDKETGNPIFVFIHGGYWQELDRSSSGSFVAPYVERDYRVLVVDYNLCPTVTLEQLIEQTLEFFEWLSEYAKDTNTTHIELSGHSAGAHLCALIFSGKLSSSSFCSAIPITKVYLISGVYDLRELWPLPSVNDNDILSLDLQKSKELSPMLWHMDVNHLEFLKKLKVSVHVIVGQFESPTFINQSKEYAAHLRKEGLADQVLFKVFENYDHFDIIEEVFQKNTTINKYFMQNSS